MRDETQCCFHNLISTQIFRRALAPSVDRCDETLQASLSGTDHPSNSTRTGYATEDAFLTSEHLSADAVIYHWRERPQVSFLSRQKYACRDKTFLVAKVCLSRQNYVCRSKHVFVATKLILVAAPANDSHRPPKRFLVLIRLEVTASKHPRKHEERPPRKTVNSVSLQTILILFILA